VVRPRNAGTHWLTIVSERNDQGMTPGTPLVRRAAAAPRVRSVILQADDTAGTDRVAIVTGGSRGLGRAITLELAGRGYAVVVSYTRNQSAADGAVEEVLAANGSAVAVRGDIADEFDVERLFAESAETFGGVDVVVHAEGPVVLGPLADCDLDTFDALLRTRVRGTFIVNRRAAREADDQAPV
jgi:NAD(P)-dependent dehydrogenase (short-subunit alcohol dehydrogenase family)